MGKKITADCCDKLGNINYLNKQSFRLDSSDCPTQAVCFDMPEGDANKCTYAEGIYPDALNLGDEVCFLECVVDVGKKLFTHQVIVAFNGTGQFKVKVDGVTVMRLITSVAQPTISIKLENAKPINQGEKVEVCFCGPCEGEYSATLIGTQFST